MVAIVTKITERPSTSIPFTDPSVVSDRVENGLGTWPGWLSGHTTFSDDGLTKTRISYWETVEHYNNPTLTEAQILWNEKNMKWYKDYDFFVTITIDSLD
jgi:hypothetical protein